MLQTITKRLEICIAINIEISKVDMSYSHKVENLISRGRLENFLKKNKRGDAY